MINCMIVDDEAPALDVLTRFIRDTPFLSLKASTTDVTEAIENMHQQPIDLFFLDIDMPKLNGLQFIDLYCENKKVILTSAYSEYALAGYEHNVVDYLLKPIPFARFLKASQRALNQLTAERSRTTEAQSQSTDFLLVKTEHKGKLRKINFSDIVYIEGMKNYVTIHTNKREPIITYVGMGELEERLPTSRFVRVHRSYMVALDYIIALDGNEIIMRDSPRIPMTTVFKGNLLTKFNNNLLQK